MTEVYKSNTISPLFVWMLIDLSDKMMPHSLETRGHDTILRRLLKQVHCTINSPQQNLSVGVRGEKNWMWDCGNDFFCSVSPAWYPPVLCCWLAVCSSGLLQSHSWGDQDTTELSKACYHWNCHPKQLPAFSCLCLLDISLPLLLFFYFTFILFLLSSYSCCLETLLNLLQASSHFWCSCIHEISHGNVVHDIPLNHMSYDRTPVICLWINGILFFIM